MSLASRIDAHFYPCFGDNWDDTLLRERVLSLLRRSDIVLDLGAGSGLLQQMNFRGVCERVCGLDPSPLVLNNHHLDEARTGTAESIPWPDSTFDLVISNNVLEHLPAPQIVFDEVYRVLKPGGYFLFKTPNRYHYVGFTSSLLHHRFHVIINQWRGRKEADTFPTFYYANTRRALLRLGSKFAASIEAIEGRPEYTRSPPLSVLYPFGLLWERLVNSSDLFSCFRVILVGTFSKANTANTRY